jgi:hypothetical protein
MLTKIALYKKTPVNFYSLQKSEFTYWHCWDREGFSAVHLLASASYLTSVFLLSRILILSTALE